MSEYYKRIVKHCFSTHRYYVHGAPWRAKLFQRLLLPVGDWYEQCGCTGTRAKHGVCRRRCSGVDREEQVKNKEQQFKENK